MVGIPVPNPTLRSFFGYPLILWKLPRVTVSKFFSKFGQQAAWLLACCMFQAACRFAPGWLGRRLPGLVAYWLAHPLHYCCCCCCCCPRRQCCPSPPHRDITPDDDLLGEGSVWNEQETHGLTTRMYSNIHFATSFEGTQLHRQGFITVDGGGLLDAICWSPSKPQCCDAHPILIRCWW